MFSLLLISGFVKKIIYVHALVDLKNKRLDTFENS